MVLGIQHAKQLVPSLEVETCDVQDFPLVEMSEEPKPSPPLVTQMVLGIQQPQQLVPLLEVEICDVQDFPLVEMSEEPKPSLPLVTRGALGHARLIQLVLPLGMIDVPVGEIPVTLKTAVSPP
jgi:hypothetical protein